MRADETCLLQLEERGGEPSTNQNGRRRQLAAGSSLWVGGQFPDDLDMPLGVVEERRVEFGKFVAQASVLMEATGIDDLGGGLPRLRVPQIHRDAAHDHGQGDQMVVREFDPACLKELRHLGERERFQPDRGRGDPIVKAALVTQ